MELTPSDRTLALGHLGYQPGRPPGHSYRRYRARLVTSGRDSARLAILGVTDLPAVHPRSRSVVGVRCAQIPFWLRGVARGPGYARRGEHGEAVRLAAEAARRMTGPGRVRWRPRRASKSACSFDWTSTTKRALASSCSSWAFSFCSRAICASRGSAAGGREAMPGPPAPPCPGTAASPRYGWSTGPPAARSRPSHPAPPRRRRPRPPVCTAR